MSVDVASMPDAAPSPAIVEEARKEAEDVVVQNVVLQRDLAAAGEHDSARDPHRMARPAEQFSKVRRTPLSDVVYNTTAYGRVGLVPSTK